MDQALERIIRVKSESVWFFLRYYLRRYRNGVIGPIPPKMLGWDPRDRYEATIAEWLLTSQYPNQCEEWVRGCVQQDWCTLIRDEVGQWSVRIQQEWWRCSVCGCIRELKNWFNNPEGDKLVCYMCLSEEKVDAHSLGPPTRHGWSARVEEIESWRARKLSKAV